MIKLSAVQLSSSTDVESNLVIIERILAEITRKSIELESSTCSQRLSLLAKTFRVPTVCNLQMNDKQSIALTNC